MPKPLVSLSGSAGGQPIRLCLTTFHRLVGAVVVDLSRDVNVGPPSGIHGKA